jgi:hypothetical protein
MPTVTEKNTFRLHVIGRQEYVNPCAQVGAVLKSKLEFDSSLSFSYTGDSVGDSEFKLIAASTPLEIEADTTTLEHECKVFYKLYIMNYAVSPYAYVDWATYRVQLEEQFSIRFNTTLSIDAYGNLKGGFNSYEVKHYLREQFTEPGTD